MTAWQNTGSAGGTFTAVATASPTLVSNATPNGSSAILFNGSSNVLEDATFGQTITQGTIFLVVAPLANSGGYNAFFSGIDESAPGHQDYSSGINIDMGSSGSSSFSTLNTESAFGGGGGGTNLKTDSSPFGTFQVLAITVNSSTSTLYVDGNQEGSRSNGSGASSISLNDVRVGARYYDNGGGPYQTGYLDGYVADVEVFDSVLSSSDLSADSQALMNEYINPAAPPPSTAPEPSDLTAFGLLLTGGALMFRARKAASNTSKLRRQLRS